MLIYYGEPIKGSLNEYELTGFPALLPFLFWIFLILGAENFLGATLGNLIVGLKPISINGTDDKITIGQSFKRHLLDIVDMSLFGLIGFIAIKYTDKNQRLGDLWAKTIVVKKEK